jgi:hypothetical protein
MYTITHSNGTRTTEHDTETEARAEVERVYGPDVVYQEDWQSDGPDSERLLVWLTEEDADNDPGANAVASIRRENEDESTRLD